MYVLWFDIYLSVSTSEALDTRGMYFGACCSTCMMLLRTTPTVGESALVVAPSQSLCLKCYSVADDKATPYSDDHPAGPVLRAAI